MSCCCSFVLIEKKIPCLLFVLNPEEKGLEKEIKGDASSTREQVKGNTRSKPRCARTNEKRQGNMQVILQETGKWEGTTFINST